MLRIEDIDEPAQILEPFSFGGDVLRVDLSDVYDTVTSFSAAVDGAVKDLDGPTEDVNRAGVESVQQGRDHADVINKIRPELADAWPTYQEWVADQVVEVIPDVGDAVEDLSRDGEDIVVDQPFPTRSDPARTWQEIYEEIRREIAHGPPRVP